MAPVPRIKAQVVRAANSDIRQIPQPTRSTASGLPGHTPRTMGQGNWLTISFEYLLGRPTESERLPSDRKAKILSSVAEFVYDWLKTEGYLGNVSKYNAN